MYLRDFCNTSLAFFPSISIKSIDSHRIEFISQVNSALVEDLASHARIALQRMLSSLQTVHKQHLELWFRLINSYFVTNLRNITIYDCNNMSLYRLSNLQNYRGRPSVSQKWVIGMVHQSYLSTWVYGDGYMPGSYDTASTHTIGYTPWHCHP